MTPDLMDVLQETERYLHQEIPITKAMGVRVASFDARGLTLTAPLGENHNHLGTAFGGSLSAIATLAGYSLLWLELGDRDVHVVVKNSSIRYLHPVRGEIVATCPRLDAVSLHRFRTRLASSGKAGVELAVGIVSEGRTCVEFSGVFVAVK